MTIIVTFTDAAAHYIKNRLTKEQGVGFRLSVKKTGCSGYTYLPTIVDTVNEADVSFETTHGIPVFIDTKWSALLQGLHVDYVEEDKTGLKQKRLVFINPKESSRCGCGESFHIEGEQNAS